MSTMGKCIISIMLGASIIIGCKSTPNEVLPQEDMAQLLADIHIGESIVDGERTKFYNDSLKKTVKQSILVKHRVTQSQLDTSFAWYGHNIEEYIEVYDRVIAILDEKTANIGGANEMDKIALEGDSVDVWSNQNHYSINYNSPSQYITFSRSKDQHWEKGDNYTWRLKLINNISPLKWELAADYSDGTSEFINATLSNEGWNELKFVSDSTKILNRVYGYIYATPKESEIIYIDSISLIRLRADKNTYRQRATQRKFEYNKNKSNNKNEKTDIDTLNHSNKKSNEASIKSNILDKNTKHKVRPTLNRSKNLSL